MEGQTVCQSADALQLQKDTYFSHLFIGSFMSFYTDSGSWNQSSIIFFLISCSFQAKCCENKPHQAWKNRCYKYDYFSLFFKFASVRLWTVQFLCLGERSVWCFCFVLLIPGMLGFCGNVILKVAALQRLSAAPADGGPLLMHDSFTAHYRPTLHPAQASPLGYLMEAIAWGVGGGGESLHIRPVIGWLGSI